MADVMVELLTSRRGGDVDPNVLPVSKDVGCPGCPETWSYCQPCVRRNTLAPRFFEAPVYVRWPAPAPGDAHQPDPHNHCAHRRLAAS